MRRFANLFLLLFLFDAGFSLLNELLAAAFSPQPLLSSFCYYLASLVVVLSIVLYGCLGIDRRLPKRVFLPLTLYASWSALELWPLSGIIAHASLGLIASLSQLLLGGVALFLLQREPCAGPRFSWRNTLVFTAVNLLLLPFALLFSGLATASYYFEQQTAGFLRLSPVGIYMSERSYHLDEKVVRLTGMMHIGKEDYYKELAEAMSGHGTVILAEGVTDQEQLLAQQFNYSKLAGVIGLSSQEVMRIDGNLVDLDNFRALVPEAHNPAMPDIARADIDLNRFEPQTIEFLNVLGRTLFGDKPLLEGLAEYNLWVNENMTTERIGGIMADILDKRNVTVIDGMLRAVARYDTIIIPWGAMHMPAIEAAVLERGFVAGEVRERLSLDFRTLPYGALWQKFSDRAE